MPEEMEIQARIERRASMEKAVLERSGYSPELFSRVMLNALVMNPQIGDCDVRSLDRAMLQCIELGLMPDGRQAAIVPFKGNATLIPMIEGRIEMARRATPGLALRVRVVYASDDWEYSEGLTPVLKHTPQDGSRSEGDLVAAYAIAIMPRSTAPEFEVMSRADIDRYRAFSAAKSRGPWASHFAEMAKKTVLGQLLKRLPKVPGDIDSPPGLDHVAVTGFVDGMDFTPEPALEPITTIGAPTPAQDGAPASESSGSPRSLRDSRDGPPDDALPPPPEEEAPPPPPPDEPAARSVAAPF